jgi:hypothetical protein
MFTQIQRLEHAARLAMGDMRESDPLPPGPIYGPFGYFRLALLVFAAAIGGVLIFNIL